MGILSDEQKRKLREYYIAHRHSKKPYRPKVDKPPVEPIPLPFQHRRGPQPIDFDDGLPVYETDDVEIRALMEPPHHNLEQPPDKDYGPLTEPGTIRVDTPELLQALPTESTRFLIVAFEMNKAQRRRAYEVLKPDGWLRETLEQEAVRRPSPHYRTHPLPEEPEPVFAPKKRGRPKGSKNR